MSTPQDAFADLLKRSADPSTAPEQRLEYNSVLQVMVDSKSVRIDGPFPTITRAGYEKAVQEGDVVVLREIQSGRTKLVD